MIFTKKRTLFILLIICQSLTGFTQTRTLSFYINEGLQNSPLLKDLQNQLNSVSLDSLMTAARKKPQIEGRSNLLYAPFTNNFGYDEVITDGGNYQAGAFVSQEIFNSKKLENSYQAIDIQKQTLSNSKKLSVAELKRAITSTYLESYSYFTDLIFNRSFLDLIKNEGLILSKFVESGIYTRTDHLSMLVETEGQEVIVSQLKNQYEKNIRLLNELCGLKDTAHVQLLIPVIDTPAETSLPNYLFLKQYGLDSLQIINERIALNLKYKPFVKWFADAGVLTSTPLYFYRNFGFSAGISLSVPIYDGHQKKLEDQKLVFRENTRSSYNFSSRKQYDQQFLRLKADLEGLKEVKSKLEKQIAIADQLVKSLKAQLETGMIRMTDYINAIKNLRNINHNVNLVNIGMLSIMNEMNYILTQ
jgi:outer membrane protein TolC